MYGDALTRTSPQTHIIGVEIYVLLKSFTATLAILRPHTVSMLHMPYLVLVMKLALWRSGMCDTLAGCLCCGSSLQASLG